MNIAEDVLLVVRSRARRERRSMGSVISELARKGLERRTQPDEAPEPEAFHGFRPLPHRGRPVTNEVIDELREDGPY